MRFALYAYGVDFDPVAYTATSQLVFDGIYHQGESGNNRPNASGVYKTLGDGEVLTFAEQERAAIVFLKDNREALKVLKDAPGVTTFSLCLIYRIDCPINLVGFSIPVSSLLMWHCLEIGITAYFHVTLVRLEGSD